MDGHHVQVLQLRSGAIFGFVAMFIFVAIAKYVCDFIFAVLG